LGKQSQNALVELRITNIGALEIGIILL